MAVKGAGTPIEIRIPDGDGGSLLVPGELLLPVENLGEMSDVQLVADPGRSFAGYTYTANAANAGEFRLKQATDNTLNGLANSQLLGLANNTPIDQSGGVGTFWALGPNGERTIATTIDRIHTFYEMLATRPDTWYANVVDTLGCAINFEFRFRTKDETAYAGSPELTVSSSSFETIGTRRTIAIDFAGTLATSRFPSLMQVRIENRGNNDPVEVNRQYAEFPDP